MNVYSRGLLIAGRLSKENGLIIRLNVCATQEALSSLQQPALKHSPHMFSAASQVTQLCLCGAAVTQGVERVIH